MLYNFLVDTKFKMVRDSGWGEIQMVVRRQPLEISISHIPPMLSMWKCAHRVEVVQPVGPLVVHGVEIYHVRCM